MLRRGSYKNKIALSFQEIQSSIIKASADQVRQQYQEHFDQEWARLNPAQKEAVETIEGPVLVLAGPGTGKTHILSARIGHILRSTDTQANNILCLTYTDAGANAMRKRLLQFIGPESHKVHIFTFHSFCNQIVKENLSLFGMQDLEIATELERIEIIRELIDELPTGHTLKNNRYMPYLHERKLIRLFDLMKSENWTVEGLLQASRDRKSVV